MIDRRTDYADGIAYADKWLDQATPEYLSGLPDDWLSTAGVEAEVLAKKWASIRNRLRGEAWRRCSERKTDRVGKAVLRDRTVYQPSEIKRAADCRFEIGENQ